MEIDFVRSKEGEPTLEDFGGGGTPLIVNTLTGQAFLKVKGVKTPIAPITLAPSGGDDSDAINDALGTGKSVVFQEGTYYANNLTQSGNGQRLVAAGVVQIIKNGNGPLFTSTGQGVQVHGIEFRGEAASPAYTGDNVVSSGASFAMLNCGSRWAHGRAVKATGNHVQIVGTCDIYQTADADGYDIELGQSGTATLYHRVTGIYSSQATGGILLTDTGAATISESQFGKIKIAAGTKPSGSGGGMTHGCRILGAVDVELSSAIFIGNQFGAVQITFAANTSGCRMSGDVNTFQSGAAITNNGNSTNNPNVHPTL